MSLPEPSPSPSSVLPSTSYDPEVLIRDELLQMAPYTPILPYDILADRLGRHPSEIVKLDANENPYGPSPSVFHALSTAEHLHIYPDPESTALRDALSDYTSVPPEYILAGAGADELIDLLFRLFVTPGAGDSVVNCPPTFGMYQFDADVSGADVVNVRRRARDFSVDVDGIERVFAERSDNPPKMVFIASPNNPDGSTISDADVRRLLALPTLLVLDEAYFEFSVENRFSWVPSTPNLVVLRTFSKWAGLAGMRVGYGAFPLSVIKHLWKIKQPYNVSVGAQIAGIASIKDKGDLLGKVERMVRQRDQFYERVRQFDWLHPYPSCSNYVLCRIRSDDGKGRTALHIKEQLLQRGILIRYYTSTGLTDCIRISMGTKEQMECLYKALAEL